MLFYQQPLTSQLLVLPLVFVLMMAATIRDSPADGFVNYPVSGLQDYYGAVNARGDLFCPRDVSKQPDISGVAQPVYHKPLRWRY